MAIVNITIRYTQPELMPGQTVNTVDHVVEVDDAQTYPNGQPVPTQNNEFEWAGVLEHIDDIPTHEVI